MTTASKCSLAVFASENGPGDAERASIMSQAGTFLAKQGAAIICLVHENSLCVPLNTSARSAGGEVTLIAREDFEAPPALEGITVQRFASKAEQLQHLGQMADAFVGLPGSLASVTDLYETWLSTGGTKPVTLLNRNGAYEIMRGFAVDLLAHSKTDWERKLQFADSIEDLWSRVSRTLNAH